MEIRGNRETSLADRLWDELCHNEKRACGIGKQVRGSQKKDLDKDQEKLRKD